jgi:hypothetical protein
MPYLRFVLYGVSPSSMKPWGALNQQLIQCRNVFWLFAFRLGFQHNLFSLQSIRKPLLKRPPYVVGILAPNLTAILFHLFTSTAEASEATRGYLHGGFFLDFIGQSGSSSSLRLLAFDVVIFVIQLLQLAILIMRIQLKASIDSNASLPPNSNDNGAEESGLFPQQDYDSEERGLVRPIVVSASGAEMVELHSFTSPRRHHASLDMDVEALSVHDMNHRLLRELPHPLDSFSSGNAVLADFYPIDTFRQQWRLYRAQHPKAQAEFRSTFASHLGSQRILDRFNIRRP